MSGLEDRIARLYSLPLGEFTTARNALAKELKKKDKEAAERIQKLAKPPASAWAVNRLFEEEAARMKALLAAGEKARKGLHSVLTEGDPASLQEALQEQRKLRDDLHRRALALLEKTKQPASPAVAERLGVNLESLALSPDAAATAERGWLDSDLDPPGFEVLAGLQLGSSRPKRGNLRLVPEPAPAQAAPERKEKAEKNERKEREEARARERLARAEEKAAAAQEEAASRRHQARQAERVAEKTQKTADKARRLAESAGEAAERAEAEAARLRGSEKS
jgi:hypothetical protein